jgi:hypothetical protein
MRSLVVVALVAGATGCGLDMRGLGGAAPGDASTTTDAPLPVGADGGSGSSGGPGDDGGSGSGGTDSGGGESEASTPDADASACVASLPSGWSLVAYETSRATCPGGYGPHDAIAGATPGAGACVCNCTVATQPSCTQGTLVTQWSSTGASPGPCVNAGVQMPVSGSGCTNLPAAGQLAQGFSASPFASTGGACTAAVHADPSKVAKDAVRTCAVPQSAADAVCSGSPPAGFSACIAAPGDVPCPAGPFAVRTVIQDDVELVCAACGACSVSAACANAQVKFYSDPQCGTVVTQLPCNATCVDTGAASSKQVAAFEYTAQVQASCQASPSGAASLNPVKPQTLCCR